MEVFGQLHWALEDAGAYFEAQLFEIGEALGLDCPVPEEEEARGRFQNATGRSNSGSGGLT
jgi:hypothetical protein